MREYQEVRRHPMLTKQPHFLSRIVAAAAYIINRAKAVRALVSADRVINVRRRSGKAAGSRMASFVAMNSDATTFSEP